MGRMLLLGLGGLVVAIVALKLVLGVLGAVLGAAFGVLRFLLFTVAPLAPTRVTPWMRRGGFMLTVPLSIPSAPLLNLITATALSSIST